MAVAPPPPPPGWCSGSSYNIIIVIIIFYASEILHVMTMQSMMKVQSTLPKTNLLGLNK